jgi:hypothetical protein
MQNVPLVFTDTKTTGLIPGLRATWELAIIREEPDGKVEEYVTQLRLMADELNEADPKSLEISMFNERYVGYNKGVENFRNLPTDLEIRKEIERLCSGPAHFVGMCPDFDALNLIHRFFFTETQPWYYQLIDVDIFAAGVLLAGGHNVELPFDTTRWAEFLGVKTPDEKTKYTALGDARWTREFYHEVIKYSKYSSELVRNG